jgi:hypothetical protein
MENEQIKRLTYRWSKEARDLVNEYLRMHEERASSLSESGPTLRTLVTSLAALTGFPRETCLRFARQLGVTQKRPYREWTKAEQQKLLDLVPYHPPAEIAKLLHRSIGSIRGMLHLLDANAQMGREWFTAYTLAEALHIRVQEVQRWIAQGWLKTRVVETGGLKKHIIHADDFAEFCKRHRREAVGRRLNVARLDFIQMFVFPPSHVELLPAREEGYKTRRKLAVLQGGESQAVEAVVLPQGESKIAPTFGQAADSENEGIADIA